jgi:hypothetical protein
MIDYQPMSFFYNTDNFQIKTRAKILIGAILAGKFQIKVNFSKDTQIGQRKFQSFHPKFVNDTV